MNYVNTLFDDITGLFGGLDSVLVPAALPARSTRSRRAFPAVEAMRRGDQLLLRAELPGVDPATVDISVVENRLVIRGEKPGRDEASEYFVRETWSGPFERSFSLPRGIAAEHVSARHENGVLEITLPAKPVEDASRKVPIHVEGKSQKAIA